MSKRMIFSQKLGITVLITQIALKKNNPTHKRIFPQIPPTICFHKTPDSLVSNLVPKYTPTIKRDKSDVISDEKRDEISNNDTDTHRSTM